MFIDSTLTFLSKKSKIDLHYFAKGGFWLLMTQTVTIVGSLIGTVIFAHILTEADYGTYRYVIALSVLFTTFSLTGMTQSILQTAAKGYTEFFPYGVKTSLLYSAGITISGVIGAMYYYSQGNMLLATACILIALLQPLISAYQNIVSFLHGLRLFKESAFLQVFRVTFLTLSCIITIYFTHNVLILFFVFLFSQAIGNILSSFIFKSKIDYQTPLQEEIRIRYLRFAQHTSIQNIIIGVASRLDNILVFQQLGAVNLAIFSIATLITDQVRGAFKNLLTLLIPKFAKHQNIEKNRANIPLRSLQFFGIITAISVILILLLPTLYALLFPKYLSAVYYSQLLALSLPASVSLVPLSALQSHLRDKELYAMNLYGAFFQIAITFLFITFFGLLGAIWARIISRYATTILTFYHLFKAT